MDFDSQQVTGTVSDGKFTSILQGDRAVFSTRNKATAYAGQYTMVITGAEDSTVGPYGVSYGTIKVDSLGNIRLNGSLADGTVVMQSSMVSKDGSWPIYVSLYGGKGSLWAWGFFTNHSVFAATGLSWINATNTSALALYRRGFTNQSATLFASPLVSSQRPLFGATTALVMLSGGNLPFAITNPVVIKANNTFTSATGYTNKLLGTIKADGTLSGTFSNPAKPKQLISFSGVILQNQTNAGGWFCGTNQSGAILFEVE